MKKGSNRASKIFLINNDRAAEDGFVGRFGNVHKNLILEYIKYLTRNMMFHTIILLYKCRMKKHIFVLCRRGNVLMEVRGAEKIDIHHIELNANPGMCILPNPYARTIAYRDVDDDDLEAIPLSSFIRLMPSLPLHLSSATRCLLTHACDLFMSRGKFISRKGIKSNKWKFYALKYGDIDELKDRHGIQRRQISHS